MNPGCAAEPRGLGVPSHPPGQFPFRLRGERQRLWPRVAGPGSRAQRGRAQPCGRRMTREELNGLFEKRRPGPPCLWTKHRAFQHVGFPPCNFPQPESESRAPWGWDWHRPPVEGRLPEQKPERGVLPFRPSVGGGVTAASAVGWGLSFLVLTARPVRISLSKVLSITRQAFFGCQRA